MQKHYSESVNKANYKTEELQEKKEQKLTVVKNCEVTIWENLKKGDEAALGELYNLYIDTLFSFGIQHSQDRGYIMDCIHDLFVDLYKYRKSLSTTNNIKYYLFKSLKRKINKKYSRKEIPVGMEFQYSVNEILKSHTKSHEEEIIKKEYNTEKFSQLENALCELTKKQRKGLFLRYNQEKTYEEISQIMGVSVQTARTTTYRAIKILRKYKFSY